MIGRIDPKKTSDRKCWRLQLGLKKRPISTRHFPKKLEFLTEMTSLPVHVFMVSNRAVSMIGSISQQRQMAGKPVRLQVRMKVGMKVRKAPPARTELRRHTLCELICIDCCNNYQETGF